MRIRGCYIRIGITFKKIGMKCRDCLVLEIGDNTYGNGAARVIIVGDFNVHVKHLNRNVSRFSDAVKSQEFVNFVIKEQLNIMNGSAKCSGK